MRSTIGYTLKTQHLNNRIAKKVVVLFGAFSLFVLEHSRAQDQIEWINFEQLEDSLTVKPKKVFINFYAEWCAYCKKMDRAAFQDPQVVSRLNQGYYAVKMDAETTDTIHFGGETFINRQKGKQRNPVHEIPLLLASRENQPFSLPAMLILNEQFEVMHRYFEYLSPKQLYKALEEY